MKLNAKAWGMTVGTMAGAWWLLAMGFSLLTGFGARTLSTLGSYHLWFSYSWGGLVWMVVAHLAAGMAGGWVFASLYNKFSE